MVMLLTLYVVMYLNLISSSDLVWVRMDEMPLFANTFKFEMGSFFLTVDGYDGKYGHHRRCKNQFSFFSNLMNPEFLIWPEQYEIVGAKVLIPNDIQKIYMREWTAVCPQLIIRKMNGQTNLDGCFFSALPRN